MNRNWVFQSIYNRSFVLIRLSVSSNYVIIPRQKITRLFFLKEGAGGGNTVEC